MDPQFLLINTRSSLSMRDFMKVMTDGVRKEKERLTAASMKVLVYSWQRLSFTGVLIFVSHSLSVSSKGLLDS